MTRLAWMALGACGAASPPPIAAADTTLEVCATAVYTSIQAAIDDAPNGATITVCDGTYYERLTIHGKALVLRSEHGAALTLIDAEHSGVGLALQDGADVTVDGFTLTNGSSAGLGGDVACVDARLVLTQSILVNGLASRGGGLGAARCAVDVSDTWIVANHATGGGGGGGASLADCEGRVKDVDFEGNTAYQGGGAWVTGDGLILSGNALFDNAAELGGGLYLEGSSALWNNAIERNTAPSGGGGAYVLHGDGEIRGNTFADNRSDDDGGGLYIDGGTVQIRGNAFERNAAGGDAGALRVKLSTASVEGNRFTANTAVQWGGAMKVSHDAVTLRGNLFVDNTAWKGGALALDESSSTLTGDVFDDNDAAFGGGLFVSEGWEGPVLEDCVFTSNTASRQGGGIAVEHLPGVRTLLRRVALVSGDADLGGGLYASDSDVELINSIARANAATTAGGGLYLVSAVGTVHNSMIWDNEAPAGSGVFLAEGVELAVAGTVVGRNTIGAAFEGVSDVVALDWRWSDAFANTTDFAGLDPTSCEGSMTVDPDFVDEASLDFRLAIGSPLVDAGEPGLLDLDGTRADIGLHGGPDAEAP